VSFELHGVDVFSAAMDVVSFFEIFLYSSFGGGGTQDENKQKTTLINLMVCSPKKKGLIGFNLSLLCYVKSPLACRVWQIFYNSHIIPPATGQKKSCKQRAQIKCKFSLGEGVRSVCNFLLVVV